MDRWERREKERGKREWRRTEGRKREREIIGG